MSIDLSRYLKRSSTRLHKRKINGLILVPVVPWWMPAHVAGRDRGGNPAGKGDDNDLLACRVVTAGYHWHSGWHCAPAAVSTLFKFVFG